MMEYKFEDHSSYLFDISAIEVPHMLLEKEKGNEIEHNKCCQSKKKNC